MRAIFEFDVDESRLKVKFEDLLESDNGVKNPHAYNLFRLQMLDYFLSGEDLKIFTGVSDVAAFLKRSVRDASDELKRKYKESKDK